jgi:ParB/RepB/Spo0J family partition protein
MSGKISENGILITLPIKDIVDSPYQCREGYDAQKLKELSKDIASNGLQIHPQVRPLKNGKFELVHGHYRVAALKELGRTTVDCFVKDFSDFEAFKRHISENVQRTDLSPIEEAKQIMQFKDFLEKIEGTPVTYRRLSQELSYAPQTLYAKMDLLLLPDDVQQKLHKHEISTNFVNSILQLIRGEPGDGLRTGKTTTEYFPQIRRLVSEIEQGHLKSREALTEAASNIKKGVDIEEAITHARINDSVRESQKLLVRGKEPADILATIISSQPDIQDDILTANLALLRKMVRSGFVKCPNCEKSKLVWACCGKEVDADD